jgi:hypothetical protein
MQMKTFYLMIILNFLFFINSTSNNNANYIKNHIIKFSIINKNNNENINNNNTLSFSNDNYNYNTKINKNKFNQEIKLTCKNPLLNNILKLMKENNQISNNKKIQEVFCKVDRNNFLRKKINYGMDAIYIGHGSTLSGPIGHILALEKCYEKFDINKKLKILDIGSGSGIMYIEKN